MSLYEIVQSERRDLFFLGTRDIVTNKFIIEKIFFSKQKANLELMKRTKKYKVVKNGR